MYENSCKNCLSKNLECDLQKPCYNCILNGENCEFTEMTGLEDLSSQISNSDESELELINSSFDTSVEIGISCETTQNVNLNQQMNSNQADDESGIRKQRKRLNKHSGYISPLNPQVIENLNLKFNEICSHFENNLLKSLHNQELNLDFVVDLPNNETLSFKDLYYETYSPIHVVQSIKLNEICSILPSISALPAILREFKSIYVFYPLINVKEYMGEFLDLRQKLVSTKVYNRYTERELLIIGILLVILKLVNDITPHQFDTFKYIEIAELIHKQNDHVKSYEQLILVTGLRIFFSLSSDNFNNYNNQKAQYYEFLSLRLGYELGIQFDQSPDSRKLWYCINQPNVLNMINSGWPIDMMKNSKIDPIVHGDTNLDQLLIIKMCSMNTIQKSNQRLIESMVNYDSKLSLSELKSILHGLKLNISYTDLAAKNIYEILMIDNFLKVSFVNIIVHYHFYIYYARHSQGRYGEGTKENSKDSNENSRESSNENSHEANGITDPQMPNTITDPQINTMTNPQIANKILGHILKVIYNKVFPVLIRLYSFDIRQSRLIDLILSSVIIHIIDLIWKLNCSLILDCKIIIENLPRSHRSIDNDYYNNVIVFERKLIQANNLILVLLNSNTGNFTFFRSFTVYEQFFKYLLRAEDLIDLRMDVVMMDNEWVVEFRNLVGEKLKDYMDIVSFNLYTE